MAIVTGAGRGIGRAVAMLLAQEGASVVVNDLGGAVDGRNSSKTPAGKVVTEIHSCGGSAIADYNSVANFDESAKIVKKAIDAFGRIDILCNAAGIIRDRMIFNMTEEEWDSVINVHLYGAFNMVRNSIPHMRNQGYGRIVLFSSSSGLGSIGQSNYASAKEGLVGFAKSLSRELATVGITVNAVYPIASTRMMATLPENTLRRLESQRQLTGVAIGPAEMTASPEPKEALSAENNAPKIAYLCSEGSGEITGQVIGTGGWTMSLFSERHPTKSIHKNGLWTLDELEQLIPISLAAGLINPSPAESPSRSRKRQN